MASSCVNDVFRCSCTTRSLGKIILASPSPTEGRLARCSLRCVGPLPREQRLQESLDRMEGRAPVQPASQIVAVSPRDPYALAWPGDADFPARAAVQQPSDGFQ